MKKIYFFLTLLLTLFGAQTLKAQNEIAISVTKQTGEWSNGNGSSWAKEWTSYEVNGGSVVIRDANNNNNMNYWDGTNIQFYNCIAGSGTSHNYTITASSGYEIKSVEFDFVPNYMWNGNNSTPATFVSVSFTGGETFENGNDSEPVHASLTGLEETTSIEITMGSDQPYMFIATSNFVVTIQKQDELDAARAEMEEVVTHYRTYVSDFNDNIGTQPGNYSAETVTAFIATLDNADTDNPDFDLSTLTVEKCQELAQAIIDAYNAVLASKVPMTLADGYYRIKSGMRFTQTKTVTDDEGEETTVTEYVDKYMYTQKSGNTISGYWHTPDNVDTDCPTLWKVTNKDGFFDLQNMATDGRFVTAKTMAVESETLMALDPVTTTGEGVTYVNIRVSTDAADAYNYIHTAGHASGSGVSGSLTTWRNTWRGDDGVSDAMPRGSEWVFVPVDDEVAEQIMKDYEPIKNEELMRENYKVMLADAKEKIEMAKDVQRIELITDVSKITFVKTDPNEGSEEAIMDNNASSFWHSDWHNKDAYGRPSLTIELAEPIQNFTWFIQRRASGGDHVTMCNILAGNDKENLNVVVPNQAIENPSSGAKFETEIDLGAAYKYVKFEFTDSYANSRRIDGEYLPDPDDEEKVLVYAHFAEFHMLTIKNNPNAQANYMGDLLTNLEAVIEAQKDLEMEDLTPEQYNALKTAYEAFLTKFVDPTELRQTLADRKSTTDGIKVGNNPGFWASDSDAKAYTALYNEAKAYDEKGDYTPEKSANYVEQLNSKAESLMASANKIKEGKWYRIRFASEADFEEHSWNKNAGYAEGDEINEPLWNKYLTGAYYEAIEGSENGEYQILDATAEDIAMGENIFFDADEDINEKDLSLFRFIAVGDSAYMLQNKGTNMFLKANGTSGSVTFSVHPSLFDVSAVGYGFNVIHSRSITGNNQNYLHGQKAHNLLVTWSDKTAGTASALYIEEAGDVSSDYVGDEFNVSVREGQIHTFCFPIDVTVDKELGEMYDVKVEDNKIILFPIEKASAGRPFIYIHGGDLEAYNPDSDEEYTPLKHGYTLVNEAGTSSPLKGVFATTRLDRGEVYASGNTFVVNKVSKNAVMDYTTIGANQAYIATDEPFDINAQLEIVIDNSIEDAIEGIVNEKIVNGKYTYDLSGRPVSTNNAPLSTLHLKKGVYIRNGRLVVIK